MFDGDIATDVLSVGPNLSGIRGRAGVLDLSAVPLSAHQSSVTRHRWAVTAQVGNRLESRTGDLRSPLALSF